MKNKFLYCFILLSCVSLYAQDATEKQKIAIYVIGDSELKIEKDIVNAIEQRSVYSVEKRTVDLQEELKKDSAYQQSKNVDYGKIWNLGYRFGVQSVCVVEVRETGSAHFMSAILINVKDAFLNASSHTQKFNRMEDVPEASKAVVASLFGELRGVDSSFQSSAFRHPSEPEMVFVQGGTFEMGYNIKRDSNWNWITGPLHDVTLSDFYIGKYEVTQAQWQLLMGNNPSHFRGDSLPVEMVSWEEVHEFIRRLNEISGKQYRLPTEAEWEYAAQGGNKSKGYRYSGSNDINKVAWFVDNSNGTTHPVGTKSANELGIYDMSGNVSEWCFDGYNFLYNNSPQINPMGSVTGNVRVRRGGAYNVGATSCHVALHSEASIDYHGYVLGFRLVSSSRIGEVWYMQKQTADIQKQTALEKAIKRINVSMNIPSFLSVSQNEDLIGATSVTEKDSLPAIAQIYGFEPAHGATFFNAMLGLFHSTMKYNNEDCMLFVYVSPGRGGSTYGQTIVDSDELYTLQNLSFGRIKGNFRYGQRMSDASEQEARVLYSMLTHYPKEQAQKLFNANVIVSYPVDLQKNVFEGKYTKCNALVMAKDRLEIYVYFMLTDKSEKNFDRYLNMLEKVFWFNE